MTNKEYRLNLLIDIAVREGWFNRFQWKVLNSQKIDKQLELLDEVLEKKDKEFKEYVRNNINKLP